MKFWTKRNVRGLYRIFSIWIKSLFYTDKCWHSCGGGLGGRSGFGSGGGLGSGGGRGGGSDLVLGVDVVFGGQKQFFYIQSTK